MATEKDIQRVARQFGFNAVAFISFEDDNDTECIQGSCFNDAFEFCYRILEDGTVEVGGFDIDPDLMDEEEFTEDDVLEEYAEYFNKAAALKKKLAQFNVRDFKEKRR